MAPPAEGQPATRSRRRLILIVVGALIIVAIATVIGIVALTGDDNKNASRPDQRDQTAITYVDAINTGDPATVCRLETERQRNNSQEACEKENAFMRGRNVKADDPKVVASKQLAEGTGVVVEYHLTTGGSTPSHDVLRLVQQADGSWLIDEADSADAQAMASGDPIGNVLGERREGQ
ncbi:hypothetical protein ACGFIF_42915 [Kribbella sp. NPDC049174]|uniref:hypothetical protein n=1 Tax=Kribbella sp. NPDC049174 TaxID=3364112 RepID=UPI00370F8C02